MSTRKTTDNNRSNADTNDGIHGNFAANSDNGESKSTTQSSSYQVVSLNLDANDDKIEIFDPEDPSAAIITKNKDIVAVNVKIDDSENKPKLVLSDHSLRSTIRGDSECEQLAERIEERRANRMPVTHEIRVEFLKTCQKICLERGYPSKSKILVSDLLQVERQLKEKVDDATHLKRGKFKICKPSALIPKLLGFHNLSATLLDVIEKAVELTREDFLRDDDWFSYRDFSFYYTRVESKWPWMRKRTTAAFVVIFLYYFFTPIFFCHVLNDKGICEEDPTGQNRSYYGWVSSLYFASTTMSTVGYGDLTVEKTSSWRVFMGIMYMIVSVLMAFTAFNAAFEAAASPFAKYREKLLELIPWYRRQKARQDLLLYQRIRLLKFVRLTEIGLQFTVLNMIGFGVSRVFAADESWTVMESLYWAVQTTTTVGYGDLTIPFSMRWFNIVYLALSTYMVGNTLGKLANLKCEMEEIRRYYAWERREISAGMVQEFQASGHDDVVDQYEFVLASLLTLGKVRSEDITPIMDKFRDLAGEKGFIFVSKDIGGTETGTSIHSDFDLDAEANAQAEVEQVDLD